MGSKCTKTNLIKRSTFATVTKNLIMMYNNGDFNKFYVRYKPEALQKN